MKNLLFFNAYSFFFKVAFVSFFSILVSGPASIEARTFPNGSGNETGLNLISAETFNFTGSSDPKCTDLPTVTTLGATAVTATCATLKGIVNPNAGPTNYFFEWGTTTDYGNSTAPKYAGAGSSNVNAFSYISGLTFSTTYHYRLVATNALGTSYGNDIIFVTANITLNTTGATAITYTTAVSGGNIISDGGSPVESRGVCWNTSPDPTTSHPHTVNGSGNGVFTSSITGLSSGTIYFVRAYAINANGTSYGSNQTFTTPACGNYTLPYLEGFSAGTLPDCWTLADHLGNDQGWQFGAISNQSPNPALSGNYAFLNSNDFGSGDSQNADLISPAFDFSSNPSITLLFNYFLLSNDGSTGTLSYSVNNGSDWTVIQSFTSTSTANPEAFSQVIPAVAGQSQVRFKWNYTGTNGSYWAIDDVQVTGTMPPLTLSVTPANQDVNYVAGSTSFSVVSNTDWSATCDQTWCEVTLSGAGDGTIVANYTLNYTALQRVATITVTAEGLSPEVVTVTQDGSIPSLNVSPTNQNIPQTGYTTTFSLTTLLSWSVNSDQLWCIVTPHSGTGNMTITAACELNTTSSTRVANITFTAAGVSPVVVTVTQAGTSLSDFMLTMQNIIQTAPNELEFDLYILDTDPTQVLPMASVQYGIYFNLGILNGSATSSDMVYVYPHSGGFSDLPSVMAPNGSSTLATGLIRIAGRAAPGCANGFIISTVAPGTRTNRFRLTSSVPFTPNSTPDFVFTSNTATNPSYATRFAWYNPACTNVQLPVISGVNAIVIGNPVLNGPPELEVAPGSQTVDTTAGNYGFTINSNTTWAAQADQPWVTVTPSGFGDGSMIATYDGNTSETRTAIITVSAPGIEDTQITLSQEGGTTRTLNLNLLIEGLYTGNGTMKQASDANGPHFEGGISDFVTVELHNSSDYSIVEHAVLETALSITGNLTVEVPLSLNGSYYITIKHRNSIETTSAYPISFNAFTINYSFDLPEKAYGGNLQSMSDGKYVLKSGDVNQDGSIDTGDITLVDNDAAGYFTGYIPADVNGDGIVDTADMTIVDNNNAEYVIAETP